MTPTPVDLSRFEKEVGVADPITFQRRANGWLSVLRTKVGTVDVCGSALDPLDALRAELNLHLGRALEFVTVARGLTQRFPSGAVSIGSGDFAAGVASVLRILPGAPTAVTAPRWRRAMDDLKVAGWLARRQVKHQWGGWRGPPLPTEANVVLAVVRSPDHLLHVVPIAKELEASHAKSVLFAVCDQKMAALVDQAGFASVDLYHCAAANPVGLGVGSALLVRRAAAAMREVRPAGFDALELDVMKRTALRVLRVNAPDLFRMAQGIQSVFEAARPSLVIAANPYTMEGRLAWRLAVANRISSAAVEHGTIFVNDPIWDELGVDTFCAWGEHSREALLACGMRNEQIAVVGSPRLDVELGKTRRSRSDHPKILVATSGPGDQISLSQHEAFIDMLYEAAADAPEVHWVVKLHRKDKVALYSAANQRGAGSRVEVVPFDASADIFDFLEGAKAMVTIASAAALEAMVARVPVITVQASSGSSTHVEFIERGCTRHVRSAHELAVEVRRAFRDEKDSQTDEASRQYATAHFANIGVAAIATAARLVATERRG